MEYKRLSEVNLKENLNKRVFVRFIGRDIEVKTQRDGVTKYISMKMVDKSTVVSASKFGVRDDEIERLQNNLTYEAAVDVKPYDRSSTGYSCIIYNIQRSNSSVAEYLDWSDMLEESANIIKSTLELVKNTTYGKIALNIMQEYWKNFSIWVAGKSMHHTELGGLLKHTASVVCLCKKIADCVEKFYSSIKINRELLLTSALLHDIGKIHEISVDVSNGDAQYSTGSSLYTHIMKILSIVDVQAVRLGIGDGNNKSKEQADKETEELDMLKHCLAAHHGKKENGSPIEASIPEALILYTADNMDAEVYMMDRQISKTEPGEANSKWVSGKVQTYYRESGK